MNSFIFLTTLSLATLLAGCSAEPSRAIAPQTTQNVVDPAIPAVTITARRMSATEKVAYDRSLTVNVADLQPTK